jgi:hypothetical protein
MAGAMTCSSRIVPYRESAIASESSTAGTVAASGPLASTLPFAAKISGVAAFGAGPCPLTTTTFRVFAS